MRCLVRKCLFYRLTFEQRCDKIKKGGCGYQRKEFQHKEQKLKIFMAELCLVFPRNDSDSHAQTVKWQVIEHILILESQQGPGHTGLGWALSTARKHTGILPLPNTPNTSSTILSLDDYFSYFTKKIEINQVLLSLIPFSHLLLRKMKFPCSYINRIPSFVC